MLRGAADKNPCLLAAVKPLAGRQGFSAVSRLFESFSGFIFGGRLVLLQIQPFGHKIIG